MAETAGESQTQKREIINDCNGLIRKLKLELETLTLKSTYGTGPYNHEISYKIGKIRAIIHGLTLKRNKLIQDIYC